MSFNLYNTISDDILHKSITDKVVVLDLDATLIATQDSFDSFKNLGIMSNPKLMELKRRCYCIKLKDVDAIGDGTRYDFWGVKRHYLEEFLLFCFNYFRLVIVWSAGQKNYVEAIVENIFKNLRKPHLVFSYDFCDIDKDKNIGKPLTKLLKHEALKKYNIKPGQVVAIDDNETTFEKNLKNAIFIPPFEPELNIASMNEHDDTLLKIKYFLLLPHVIEATDITKIDMSTIFDNTYESYIQAANN